MSYSLPHLYVTGTNYECGKMIGFEFKHRIEKFINDYNEFNNEILPFIKTDEGKQILHDYKEVIQKHFPWYFDELKGVSDGSEIKFDSILALNLSVELTKLARLSDSSKQCTDLHLLKEDIAYLLHNEDADPAIYATCYIVTCKIISSDFNGVVSPGEEFTCYCYPGNLPGNAFGFNYNGFTFGVNTLYSKKIVGSKLPHQIITRLMMSSKSLKDFENKILFTPIAYGVSINLGFCGDDLSLLNSDWQSEFKSEDANLSSTNQRLSFNYEIVPSNSNLNVVSKHCISSQNKKTDFFSKEFYAHVNCYERIKTDETEMKLISSLHRKEIIKNTKQPENKMGLLNLASDESDQDYPIYRTPRSSDLSLTTATAVFDLIQKTLEIYVFKPSSSQYFMKLDMKKK